MKTFTSPSQKIGQIGENITCEYLIRQGFAIQGRNYTKKWGEIDIIALKQGRTHFIEVKTVSCENFSRPEEQVHSAKQHRLARVIQTYISQYEIGDWQFDITCVFLDHSTRRARLKFLRDIIIS